MSKLLDTANTVNLGMPASSWDLAFTIGKYMVIALAVSWIIRWHFRRFGSTLTNRDDFSLNFPAITMTVLLIISVVKSSLALSLGLIGALSIVRFRTPIKEPEELAYLFLCIAVGLAIGADQWKSAIIGTVLILLGISLVKWGRRGNRETGLFLSLNWRFPDKLDKQDWLKNFNEAILSHAEEVSLRRFEENAEQIDSLYYVSVLNADKLSDLTNSLRNRFDNISISFLDQKNVSGF